MRYDKIPNSFFIKNRKKLTQKLKGNSIALVCSNDEMPRCGDQYFYYRQNSDFFYLTGIEQEKSILLIYTNTRNKKNREILFVRESNPKLEIWEGHKLSLDEAKQISGIENIKTLNEFDTVVHELTSSCENIYTSIYEHPKFNPEVKSRNSKMLTELKLKYPLHNFERLFPLIADLRKIKDDIEIKLIKKACSITKNAFIAALNIIKPGLNEYEIEAEITAEFVRQGANGHAYAPIIANGIHACTLHYIANNNICQDGNLLLMDIGAEYANYASDLTRAIPVNGKFTERQKEIYKSVFRLFQFAKSLMKPGTTISRINEKINKMSEEEHIKLGLYTLNDVKNQGENVLYSKYYMHGTSHFLGLDVHDVGTKEDILKPGMVLTCEPGIYIKEEGIGLRLENDILITEEGNVDLMEDIPIEPEEIEGIMNN